MDKEIVVYMYSGGMKSGHLWRSGIGSFVEMWIEYESVLQSEVSQRKTNIVY